MIIVSNTIYFKVAIRVDFKCSHHKKEMVMLRHDRGVSNTRVVIILYYVSMSTGVHLKVTQYYMSIIPQ